MFFVRLFRHPSKTLKKLNLVWQSWKHTMWVQLTLTSSLACLCLLLCALKYTGADWKWKGFSTKVFKADLASNSSKMMILKQTSKKNILFLSAFCHWKKHQKTSKQVFKTYKIIILCRKIPRFWQIEIVSNFLISMTAENWEMQTFPIKKLSIFYSKSFKSYLLAQTHTKKGCNNSSFHEEQPPSGLYIERGWLKWRSNWSQQQFSRFYAKMRNMWVGSKKL